MAAVAVALAAPFDATLATAAAHAPRVLVSVGLFVTAFGTSGYMLAISALVALAAAVAVARGRATWHGGSLQVVAERAAYVFAAVAASGIAAQILKHAVGRARPTALAFAGAFHFEPLSLRNGLASFPSGHTTSAFAAAVALGALRPEWRGRLIGLATLIGASRVLVGAHYPSDVVAGAALGTAISLALARGFARRGLSFAWRGGRAVVAPLRPGGRRTAP